MRLTELRASQRPGSGQMRSFPPQWDAAPKPKDVSCIFLSKREHFLAGTLPSWDSFSVPWNPFWGSRASLAWCAGAFPVFAIRSSPHSLLFLCEEGGGCAPGSVWGGGRVIQACCRHPAPSVCTRYLMNPGMPRGFEKPAGGMALSPHRILTSAVIIPLAEAKADPFPHQHLLRTRALRSSRLHQ